MTPALPKIDNSEYAVGWIAALPHERAAAQAMLDQKHAPPQQKQANDYNIYSLGSISGPGGEHNVVIASLPSGRYGITSAATVATQMLSSFPNIKFGLMVGIGGGIPSNDNDIRLGDIVVSKPEGNFGGVRQYDCGKSTPHGFEERGQLNSPPPVLLNAVSALESQHEMEGSVIPGVLEAIHKKYPNMASQAKGSGYVYQGAECDRLFQSDYEHASDKKSCDECDGAKVVERQERYDRNPCIHYGTIASGNQVIKDARKRDLISNSCLCFETEAAGLINNFPCLVIRGICDYSDSHKNDQWQRYAAATAAAYAKELLQITDAADINCTPYARDVMHELKEIKSIAKEIVLDRKQQELFKWLSTLNVPARHLESQKRRVEGTGRWMLEDPKFVQWCSETPKYKTLCCYGAPGAGKTIISSLVIDKLEERVAAIGLKIGFAYMYCDYRDQEGQTVENILGAILKQLLRRLLPEIPEAISKLHEERVTNEKPLSPADAVHLLRIACAQFSKVYLCLDALDEVGNLRGLLDKLRESHSSMQIFVTARQHIRDTVQEYFKEQNCVSIEAHENDIRLFIEHEIGGANDLEPDAIDQKLREDIFEKVIESAKGVFLLPALQIRAVLQATTIRDRYEALKTLPSNLDQAFSGTMSRIEQQPRDQSNKAGLIIAWIYFAERPLTVDELLCSLAVRDSDRYLDPRGIPVRKTLLNCCQGLALVDQETSTVRLIHYSLQEYLSHQDKIFGRTKAAWHSKIAWTCLTFLTFPPERPEAAIEASSGTVTLLFYAAVQWGHHLRKSNDSLDAPMELAKEYLCSGLPNNPEHLRLLYKAMYSDSYKEKHPDDVFLVHIAAFFGSLGFMSYLISISEVDMDSKDTGYGRTPLSWAARHGHEAVVRLLLEKGTELETKDDSGQTPLSLAARYGHKAVVKLLLEKGAELETKDEDYGWTPLSWAAGNDNEAVVKLLLENGAELETKDEVFGKTPLSWAARYGHEAVVKLLLENDAELETKDEVFGQTSLSRAARYGHKAVVKLLLEKGAELETKDKEYGQTPLSWAAGHGHEAVVKLLLENGAELETKDEVFGQTPLSWAARYGHEAVVKLLLEEGAELDTKDNSGRMPLLWATCCGHEAVVKLLLEKGAELEIKDKENGRTPLSWAIKNGHKAVVKLLLEEGAVRVFASGRRKACE